VSGLSALRERLHALERYLKTITTVKSENPESFAARNRAKTGLVTDLTKALPEIWQVVGHDGDKDADEDPL
jgi:hypothetical protein